MGHAEEVTADKDRVLIWKSMLICLQIGHGFLQAPPQVYWGGPLDMASVSQKIALVFSTLPTCACLSPHGLRCLMQS
jgi:hypothetical protein